MSKNVYVLHCKKSAYNKYFFSFKFLEDGINKHVGNNNNKKKENDKEVADMIPL